MSEWQPTPEQVAELEQLAGKAYWHFNRIEYGYCEYTVISDDQAGWQFPAVVFRCTNHPEKVYRAFRALLISLGEPHPR